MIIPIKPIIAQVEYPLGSLQGIGKLGSAAPADAANRATSLISTIIGLLSIIGILFFAFQLILGAIKIIGANGDKNKVSEGQNQLTQGVIGVVIIIAAVFVASSISSLLGISNIMDLSHWINIIRVQ